MSTNQHNSEYEEEDLVSPLKEIDDVTSSEDKSLLILGNCTNIINDTDLLQTNTTNNNTCMEEEPIPIPLDLTKIYVMSIIIIFTVIGNLLVITAIGARRAKMSRMYYFILHLSLADLLTAFLTLLPEVAWTFTLSSGPPYFYGGQPMCKFVKYIQMLGPYLSSYVLIITAVDRHQAICNPLGNCTWTPKRSQIMIAIAWTISLLLCIPQVLIFYYDENEQFCKAFFIKGWGVKAYVLWFTFSNFLLPLVILLFCYTRICYTIWDNVNSKSDVKNVDFWERLKKLSPWQSCQHRQRNGGPNNGSNPNQEVIANDAEGIEAIQSLQRRRRDSTSPSESSMESEDHRRFNAKENVPMETIETDSNNITKKNTQIRIHPPSMKGKNRNRSSTKDDINSGSASNNKMLRPRSHSTKNISKAKIKTIKLTMAVILGYIICSAPFCLAQIWSVFINPNIGMATAWLFWLMTLNSVVNPWIYMIFNSNLVESLERLFCPSCYESRHNAHPTGKKALRRSLLGGFKAQNIEVYETQRPSVSPRSMTLTTSLHCSSSNHLNVKRNSAGSSISGKSTNS